MRPTEGAHTPVAVPNTLAEAQKKRWERALREQADRYGTAPSAPAIAAADQFNAAGFVDVLELGAGQGRDAVFFAEAGFHVTAVDFTETSRRTIASKSTVHALGQRLTTLRHDVRHTLPISDACFDACYSHMLFCMALSERELLSLTAEIRRVLRPGGLCIYTARTTEDPDFGRGIHHAKGIYELDGFAVHFLSPETIARLNEGYETVSTERFEEGTLPRRLVRVTLRKAEVRAEHLLDLRS